MTIPDYQSLMLPLLKFLGDRKEHSLNDIVEHLHKITNLTDEQKSQLLPSGREPVFRNRIRWARLYVERAGLIQSPRRAYSIITDRGIQVLRENPPEINVKYLQRFPEFTDFRAHRKEGEKTDGDEGNLHDFLDPIELMENTHQKIKNKLMDELLKEIRKSSPDFFEKVVVELLLKMGYGGSRKDAGQAIGHTADGGIDGIIKEDRLGLDAVYLQAKRWEGTVGRPEIHKFVGALKGQGADKGVFITTSSFSKDATDYSARIDSPKVILIDGARLAELMMEYDVGVTRISSYDVKKIDSDFFAEE